MTEHADTFEARMFPLGSVLLPDAPLPLHIFEPRYQQLLNETLEGDGTFGVVLITRGSEVGGGEQRAMVGTRARIEEYNRFDDGRAAVMARGVDRFDVVEWLPDDPYPKARVRLRPDRVESGDAEPQRHAAIAAIERLLEVAERTGRLQGAPEIDVPPAPADAAWRLASAAPLTALDRQRVLENDDPATRLRVVTDAIGAIADDLELIERLDGA